MPEKKSYRGASCAGWDCSDGDWPTPRHRAACVARAPPDARPESPVIDRPAGLAGVPGGGPRGAPGEDDAAAGETPLPRPPGRSGRPSARP